MSRAQERGLSRSKVPARQPIQLAASVVFQHPKLAPVPPFQLAKKWVEICSSAPESPTSQSTFLHCLNAPALSDVVIQTGALLIKNAWQDPSATYQTRFSSAVLHARGTPAALRTNQHGLFALAGSVTLQKKKFSTSDPRAGRPPC